MNLTINASRESLTGITNYKFKQHIAAAPPSKQVILINTMISKQATKQFN